MYHFRQRRRKRITGGNDQGRGHDAEGLEEQAVDHDQDEDPIGEQGVGPLLPGLSLPLYRSLLPPGFQPGGQVGDEADGGDQQHAAGGQVRHGTGAHDLLLHDGGHLDLGGEHIPDGDGGEHHEKEHQEHIRQSFLLFQILHLFL